jgi:hypothetical protein
LGNVDNTSDANKPVSSAQQTVLDAKQATLVSGTNIKTINGSTVLGSGNISISSAVAWGGVTGTLSNQTDLQTALDLKVDENAAITGATKTKITYDAKGLVTAGADLAAGDLPTGIDAAKISTGLISNAEFDYLNGLTDNIQTQFTGKQDTLVSATNIKTINGTTLLGSGDLTISTTTPTLDAVTTAGNTTTNAITTGGFTSAGRLKIGSSSFIGSSAIPTVWVVAPANNVAQILTDSTQKYGLTYQVNGDIFNIFSDYYTGTVTPSLGFGTYLNKNMFFLNATGNIGINTTTNAGYKLDVNGTARIQNKLSVGTPTQASAVMEITSTTLGFLPPRMTTTQKNAIATPAAGLIVYDTTLNVLTYYNGTTWI